MLKWFHVRVVMICLPFVWLSAFSALSVTERWDQQKASTIVSLKLKFFFSPWQAFFFLFLSFFRHKLSTFLVFLSLFIVLPDQGMQSRLQCRPGGWREQQNCSIVCFLFVCTTDFYFSFSFLFALFSFLALLVTGRWDKQHSFRRLLQLCRWNWSFFFSMAGFLFSLSFFFSS